jgi:D-alanine-D-alanine ligase
MPHVVIIHDEPDLSLPPHHPDFHSALDVIMSVRVVHEELSEAGFDVTELPLPGNDPGAIVAALREHHPDVVVNLFEGTIERPESEAMVARLLEWLNIPFTGCPTLALRLAQNKPLAKRLLVGSGLATPEFFLVYPHSDRKNSIGWPVIVKPATQDGSIGIDQSSVVTDQDRLNEKIAQVMARYGHPVLVERFLDGRELKVGMIEWPELRTLPVSEIQHRPAPGSWPLLTYDGKWNPESADYQATPPVFPGDLKSDLVAQIERMAREAFLLFGCRDYASVDFRLAADGKPQVLEVNPNPDYHPTAGFARALAIAGISHADFTIFLVRAALRRGNQQPLVTDLFATARSGGDKPTPTA